MAVYRKTKFGWRKTGECIQCKEKMQEIYDKDQSNKTEDVKTDDVKTDDVIEIKEETEKVEVKKKKKK